MNVVMLSPGYPAEMAYFTRALAGVGARVIGVGDQPPDALPEAARSSLAHYEHVNLADEGAVLDALRGLSQHASIDRVECLWEPYMLLAARIREVFGLPGMTVEQTVPFRDKEQMKRVLDAAGIRTPWHVSARTVAEVWEAAEKVGYPLIVKPIAGAGSADTYRVNSPQELTDVLPLLRHVPEVSVEEFVDGEEFTFDTICADGRILFEHILWYRPRPLQMRMHEWVSPVSISLRDLSVPHLSGGRRMGEAVLAALGFRSGFTHMEWYLKPDGEAVFGEIGGAPAGRAGGGRHELRHRRRHLRRLGAGRGPRRDGAAGASIQRGRDLQARPRLRADHALRGLRRADGPVRRARGARRPAPGGGAAP
jgi:formate-dependent phosphoribosylglycinamide formyltransferase (GAR transformylase)